MPTPDDSGTALAVETVHQLKEPDDWVVVLLNDDYTTKDFVVSVLVTVFRLALADAITIMEDVHRKGRGMVGKFSYDIAATKADQVHALARQHEFPLRCSVEKA